MDKILKKMDSDKEVLSTLPQNNKKNLSIYIEETEKLKKEYVKYRDEIYKEMLKRYNKIISVKKSVEIEKIQIQILDIENMLETVNTIKTSYEKIGLDKIIYKLGKFYKDNLENINEEIYACINKFKNVGIELTARDFDYSIYVEEYMTIFFEEAKKGNVNSDVIKNKFEEIYWKCPDIIIHIELNLRYIYIQKQNIIDKVLLKKKESLLNTINSNPDELINKFAELNKDLINKQNIDKQIIINNFLNGKLSVKDYFDDKIQADYEKIFSKEALKEENQEEINENVIKFINSLYEYKNYEKFKFIFLDIKKKYIEREQHKSEYNMIKKEIISKEKKLKGLNKKINQRSLFGKKKEKIEKQNAQYNALVLELKESYKKLDNAEIYSKIIECLNEDSTINEVLSFAISFNNYLVNCIVDNIKSMETKEVEQFIKDLYAFLKNPYNTIIKNITLLDEKDIPIIIADRYKLLNFNISKDDISIANADALINTLSHIEIRYNMDKIGINVENMDFICEFKKILEKEIKNS